MTKEEQDEVAADPAVRVGYQAGRRAEREWFAAGKTSQEDWGAFAEWDYRRGYRHGTAYWLGRLHERKMTAEGA